MVEGQGRKTRHLMSEHENFVAFWIDDQVQKGKQLSDPHQPFAESRTPPATLRFPSANGKTIDVQK